MSETHAYLERAWRCNPFDSDLARAHSAYAGYDGAELTRLLYGSDEPHPSCLANLAAALAPHGICEDDIGTTFNVFMNVQSCPDGSLRVLPPLSRAGERIALRAESDLLVGLTACSAEQSNDYAFKPIDWSVLKAGGESSS